MSWSGSTPATYSSCKDEVCTSGMLSQLFSLLWCSTIARDAIKMWDAANLWVRSKVTWGTGFVGSCQEQQTASLAKWSRFCLLCAGQSRFGAAGTIAQKGVKMGEVIVAATWSSSSATPFSKSLIPAAVAAFLWPPTFWTIKLVFP